jgi:hypothetical protein
MILSRGLRPLSLMSLRTSLHVLTPCFQSRQSHPLLLNYCARLSASSWNKFTNANGHLAGKPEDTAQSIPQPAALSSTCLTQKQKKVAAVVERAVQAALARCTPPAHLSRYVAYLSLSVVSMSRDCYFVTIAWDCLGDDFSSAQHEQMQVCGAMQVLPEEQKAVGTRTRM